jgi:hypothetical protein
MVLRCAENYTTADISFVFNELYEFSSNIDENFIPPDFCRVASNTHARVLDNLPGGYVILPPMPGASNNLILERALAERTTPVQARIVDSEELTRHVGECDGFPRNLELMDGSCWNFGSLGGAHERHIRSL